MLSFIGIGGAGCAAVDAMHRQDALSTLLSMLSHRETRGVACDTSKALLSLRHIPPECRVLIGRSRVKGHGTGGDVELGRRIMEEEIELLLRAVRRASAGGAFMLLAGLGGGTGTGGTPVVAERLRRLYSPKLFGAFVLPSRSEGMHYIRNVSRYGREVLESVDGCILLELGVLTGRGEELAAAHRELTETLRGFLSTFSHTHLMRELRGKTASVAYLRLRAERIPLRDVFFRMLRDRVFIDTEGLEVEKVCVLLTGEARAVYGESFARKWLMERLGAEVEVHMRDMPGSKYLSAGMIITGVEGVMERYALQKEERRKGMPEDIKSLLEDIRL